jgi:hypothetical protein
LKDQEAVNKEEKASFFIRVNPEIIKLLKRKEDLEYRKLKLKKEAKRLQDMSVK